MKRQLIILIALIAVFAFVQPAFGVDLKFGGFFWTTWYATNNMKDGNSDNNDNLGSFFNTRMRLYFTAIAGENLRAVSKLELDANWGDGRIGRVSIDGGSDGRNDLGSAGNGSANSGFEIKNAYIDFTIPDTVLNFKVGLGPAKLGKSGITFNDDTPLIMATYPFAPMKISLLYSKINDNIGWPGTGVSPMTGNAVSDDWNSFGLDFTYAREMWSANFDVIYTKTSYDPSIVEVPLTASSDNDVQFWNFGLDGDYKSDVWSAYLTAAFNAGKRENAFTDPVTGNTEDSDFKGWMITVGGKYNLTDMILLGLDFYYASGRKIDSNGNFSDKDTKDFQTMGGIGRPSRDMDDIVFPGWFDRETANRTTAPGVTGSLNNVSSTGLTSTNVALVPNNIWAIGLHADFKPFEQTLIQPGLAWMRFDEKVLSQTDSLSNPTKKDDDLGFSLYVRASQGITDGLALKATFNYLFTGAAYSPSKNNDDAYKVAAGLFWSW
jgi:hypothetical protein